MFWIVTLSISVVGAIVSCLLLSWKWNRVIGRGDPISEKLNGMLLHNIAMTNPIFPHCHGFWDLKWSIIRHAAVFLILAVIVRQISAFFIQNLFFAAYIIYTWSVWSRYKARKRSLDDLKHLYGDEGVWNFCVKLVSPCKIVLFYSCICSVVLFFVPHL